MEVLVLNPGSSSVRYRVYDTAGPAALTSGSIERIGEASSGTPHHTAALRRIAATLANGRISGEGLGAIRHRKVRGTTQCRRPTPRLNRVKVKVQVSFFSNSESTLLTGQMNYLFISNSGDQQHGRFDAFLKRRGRNRNKHRKYCGNWGGRKHGLTRSWHSHSVVLL